MTEQDEGACTRQHTLRTGVWARWELASHAACLVISPPCWDHDLNWTPSTHELDVQQSPSSPGAGPGARVLPGGHSVVTEGYIRWPSLPPTHPQVTTDQPPTRQRHCNLRWIVRVRWQKHRYLAIYGVSWPWPRPFFSWRKHKTMVVAWFLLPRRGPGRKNWHLGGLST